MDINNIDLSEYDLIKVTSVSHITSPKEETLYDITVDGDHTFFIRLPNSDDYVLAHNCDGSHITAMLIGWFAKFAPNLFHEGKICKLLTPNVILTNSKDEIVKYFMSIQEFKKWEAENPNNKNKIRYLKGLGSWERDHLISLIDTNGLDKFILEYRLDEEGKVYLEDWLGSDPEKRKNHLRTYTFDVGLI